MAIKEKTKKQFLDYLKEKQGTLLTPIEVLDDLLFDRNTKRALKIKCNNGHTWDVSLGSILGRKRWCPFCYGNVKETEENFKKRLKAKHGDKITLVSPYLSMLKPATFKCNLHGEFTINAANIFSSKFGCEKCSYEARGLHRKYSIEHYLSKIKEVYKDNENLDFSLAYNVKIENNRTKIPIICKEHGVFYRGIDKLLYGNEANCPKCSKKISKNEKFVLNLLEKWELKYEREKRFADCKNIFQLPFDFCVYIGKNLYLIEVDGQQHYKEIEVWADSFERAKYTDAIKNKYCEQATMPLLRLPYYEFKDKLGIESKVHSFLFNS